MSIAAVTILAVNLLSIPVAPGGSMLNLGPDDLARERAVMIHLAMVPQPRTKADEIARLVVPADTRPDLALYAGSRQSGGQIEIGALGGGRDDAPGLLHVGIGLDF